jgi:hypothetical protein
MVYSISKRRLKGMDFLVLRKLAKTIEKIEGSFQHFFFLNHSEG